jgi:hypothetical protein
MELQEKIDQYLLDQLSSSDKMKFEELIAGDSHLKTEVAMQKSVVVALGNTSASQLKSRLQQTPISMASTGNALRLKWFGTVAAGAVATGLIIFLLTIEDKSTSSTDTISTPQSQPTEVFANTVASDESATVTVTQKTAVAEQQVISNKEKTSTSVSSDAKIKAFDNSANFEETENTNLSTPNAANSSVPANTLYTETNNKLFDLSVNVDTNNLNDKSYQFTGSKLTLFGDFNSKPYELLELNNKGQKNLFLSYNSEYYELVWGQMKKTPLKKVSHKETLEKLKVINP